MSEIVLGDSQAMADLKRFATLARQVDPDAAIRLVAAGGVLAAYVCVLPGRGLTGSGTVLGLRTFALATDASLEITTPVSAVLDRVARAGGDHTIPVPPVSLFVPWAGMTPPRTGWERHADIGSDELLEAVRAGVETLANAGTGMAAQVEALRARTWGEPLAGTPAPTGLAFAAYSLRFLTPDERAVLYRCGTWWRLRTTGGHVIAR